MTAALSLFDESDDRFSYTPSEDDLTVVAGNLALVGGLAYVPAFITSGEERVLLWEADRDGEWSTHWSRRTKSYGVSYQQSTVQESVQRRPLPAWVDFLRHRLVENGHMARLPNQMGINEYMPGQGIAAHVDYFGGTVVSLTLGSGCVMEFTVPGSDESRVSIWLPRRSIVVLRGDARNRWHHGIRGRQKDVVNGRTIKRDRRVSLTFRDVEVA